MLSKKEIKDIQSLSHKKFRKELKLFVAEGPKMVTELIRLVPQQIEKVYAVAEWIKASGYADGSKLHEIAEEELGKISGLHTPNQVLAIIRQFESIQPDVSSFTLYLDTIQDPGNFGTIIRIADWFNVRHIVCNTGCAELYNPKVVQSTMASLARVNIFYDEEDEWLPNQKAAIYAASLHGTSLYEFPKTEKGILIIGNESKGISDHLLKYANEKVTIPKKGGAESLNAAVATGILLSHLLN